MQTGAAGIANGCEALEDEYEDARVEKRGGPNAWLFSGTGTRGDETRGFAMVAGGRHELKRTQWAVEAMAPALHAKR